MHHCRTKRADHVVFAVYNNCKSASILYTPFCFFFLSPFFSHPLPSYNMEMDLTLFQQQRPHQQTQQQQHFVIDDDKTTKKRIDSAIAMKSNNQLLYISLEYPLNHIYLPGEQVTGK